MGFAIGPVRGSFNGICRLEPPDLLAVEISGPFGLRMGRLTMHGESFELEASGNVYHGLVDTLDIEQLTGFPVPESDPLVLFSPVASPPLPNAFFLNFSESGDTLWTLEVYESKQVHVYELDPGRKVILRELWKNDEGELLFEKTYLDYREKKGTLLPGTLNFVVPGDVEVTIKLKYKSPEINPVWKKDPFQFRLNPS